MMITCSFRSTDASFGSISPAATIISHTAKSSEESRCCVLKLLLLSSNICILRRSTRFIELFASGTRYVDNTLRVTTPSSLSEYLLVADHCHLHAATSRLEECDGYSWTSNRSGGIERTPWGRYGHAGGERTDISLITTSLLPVTEDIMSAVLHSITAI